MTYSIDKTQPGGSPWPIYAESAEVGQEMTTLDTVVVGDVVQLATTVSGFDENVISGDNSRWTVCELPDTGTVADNDHGGFFGVVTKAATANGKTRVVFGPCTVQIRCTTGTSVAAGDLFQIVAASGILAAPGATGENHKLVAVAARAYAGLTGGTNTIWCDFSGIFPFGVVGRVT